MRRSPHPFTLRQLQYALTVAETRSFRQAASLCAVSQPSLSAQLAQLERALGVPLFERTKRRVLPELAGAPVLLLDDGHCFREQALSWCTRAHLEELDYRATSLPTLAQMVADGAGITLLPALAVPTETQRRSLRVRPFAAPVPGRTI